MTFELTLDIDLEDMVILPGRQPMAVIEICQFTGEIILWDSEKGCEFPVNLYHLIAGVITVERTHRYVISPS